ncbi:alkaline phosphatase [Thermodesulfovibrio hydrogeniphilus]
MDRRDFLKASIGSFLAMLTLSQKVFAKTELSSISGTKGVIFLVGDGWPLGVMKAMNEFMRRKFGEESSLSRLIKNPNSKIYLMNTSSLSSVVTDSAPASVAWATGSKTINRSLSVLPNGKKLKTIFELAKDNGYSCGFVTTTRITHATPAAWYSHNPNRDDEDSIAVDLLNSGLEVAMGGGQKHFSHEKRKDRKDIFNEFKTKGYQVVKTREELLKVSTEKPILGVFNSSHISYFVDRINDKDLGTNQPSLPEMTAIALSILSRNKKGFVLLVEAGRIDHACHANDAYGAMMDCYELDKTIALLNDFITRNPDVMVIVTSDHGNSGFGINGTGPEYNDATQALLNYNNKASFEYIIKKMKGQDLKSVKEIFEHYTQQLISMDEAAEIYRHLTGKRNFVINDIWYEPEATMGNILRKSIYDYDGESTKPPARLRRGNVGFTSTNHTAEDQLAIVYSRKSYGVELRNLIDNTDLFRVMANYLGIKYSNPTMTPDMALSHIKPISDKEWELHLDLHIA